MTIGTFDGVHVGHQAILKKLVSEAQKISGESVLITFWPHPRFILNKQADELKLLSTLAEKEQMVAHLGVDYLLKIPFTPEFSSLTALQFLQDVLLNKVGTKKLLIGYDHHFGNNREGNIHFLNEHAPSYGFDVQEIPKQEIDSIGVSSTKIRKALASGEIHLANALLGRNYTITGKVVEGEKIGRVIDFPTANIAVPDSYKLLPVDGAYAIRAKIGQNMYEGMLNIGFKPTVGGKKRTIEAHLFNFTADIYKEEVTVEFVRLLRKETKFAGIDELKAQLNKDKEEALKILT